MDNRITPARAAALYVLGRYRKCGTLSQQTLQASVRRYHLQDADEALCIRLCYCVLQNSLLCDFYIQHYSTRSKDQIDPVVIDVLRLGVCQILFFDRIPDSAAVDQSVCMAKEVKRNSSGFVNAVLRKICLNKADLPDIPGFGTPQFLSIRFSHPLWFCEKLYDELGFEQAAVFLALNNQEPTLTLSANLCRTGVNSLLEKIQRSGINATVSPVSSVSIRIEDTALSVRSIPGYDSGLFFVQDSAAARTILSAGVVPGISVLDVCASPGGKSMLCASLMNNSGEIFACDLTPSKIKQIEENRDRLGFDIIQTECKDASVADTGFYNRFDLVIADIPCSGFGVIRKKPEIRYKTPMSIRRLPQLQEQILNNASAYVKTRGVLLYSTCTVLREENEQIAHSFLEQHPDFRMREETTIWPQEYGTDGFYFCVMERMDINA